MSFEKSQRNFSHLRTIFLRLKDVTYTESLHHFRNIVQQHSTISFKLYPKDSLCYYYYNIHLVIQFSHLFKIFVLFYDTLRIAHIRKKSEVNISCLYIHLYHTRLRSRHVVANFRVHLQHIFNQA